MTERQLRAFFSSNDKDGGGGVFVGSYPSSFERIYVHAISKYLWLTSKSSFLVILLFLHFGLDNRISVLDEFGMCHIFLNGFAGK